MMVQHGFRSQEDNGRMTLAKSHGSSVVVRHEGYLDVVDHTTSSMGRMTKKIDILRLDQLQYIAHVRGTPSGT